MVLIKLLHNGSVQNMGIFKIVGTIRTGFLVLAEPNQGQKMHGLLLDLAENRGAAKGTDIKSLKPKGGFTRTQRWVHDEKNVMHYSTGERGMDPKKHSVTLFFYSEDAADVGGICTIIAAGHHLNNSKDYKIVWGERCGDYATV